MSEPTPDRIWSGIDIFKVAAGTLAAVSAAVVGSFLGVAGTLVGAALASIVGSVATEVYAKSLNRGYTRIRGIRPVAPPAGREPEPATDATAVLVLPPRTPIRRPQWKRIALGAAAVFVIAMGVVLAVELLAGKPLASVAGADRGDGTTIGSVLGGADGADAPAPTTTPEPTGTTGPTAVPTGPATPSAGPTTPAPTQGPVEPTVAPTAPAEPSATAPAGQ